MSDQKLKSQPNPSLSVASDNKPRWNTIEHRRGGFHNLNLNNRYGVMFRSDTVLNLDSAIEREIEAIDSVRTYTNHPAFSAMLVIKNQTILHEVYADDFGVDHTHSIQSITKTFANLIIGELVASGKIDLDKNVGEYLPEIGSGYFSARIQDVLDMNIENDYTEDYNDPFASSYVHEATIGWRLPDSSQAHVSQFEFLCSIKSDDIINHSGYVNYKSANTDVLGWLAERVSGKPLRLWMLEIVEAAGIENAFHCSTDRNGFPVIDGGGCMTARDLARLGMLFCRRGKGVNDKTVGDANFIEKTAQRLNLRFESPRQWMGYSNQTFSNGRWIGHSGYGGQFMLADLQSNVVGVFFSVLQNDSAYDIEYSAGMIKMLQEVAEKVGQI